MKNETFITIRKSALQDKDISLQAVGFLVRLLSSPNAEISSEEWMLEQDLSGYTASLLIGELVEHGYMRRVRDKNGTTAWEFTDEPFMFEDNA